MMSHREMEVEETRNSHRSRAKSRAYGLIGPEYLFKSEIFMIKYTVGQCLAIARAIIEITDSSGGFNFVQKMPSREMRFEDNTMVFYKKDKQIQPKYHNGPLYVKVLFMMWSWDVCL